MSGSTGILLALALVSASLPFLSERVLFLRVPKSGGKHLFWRVLELAALYFAVGSVAYLLEIKQGPAHRQGWEFYVISACLFLVFGFPGFVYRYLWRRDYQAGR